MSEYDWDDLEAQWAAEDAQLAVEEAAELEHAMVWETLHSLVRAAGEKSGISDPQQLRELNALAEGIILQPEFLREHPQDGPRQVEAALARAADLVKPSQEGDEVAFAKRYMDYKAAAESYADHATRQALDWPRDKAEEDELNRGLEASAIVGEFDRERVAEVRQQNGLPELP